MRDSLDEVGIGRTLPVPLPLDAEGIALMVTHGDFQVGKIDFSVKAGRGGDANVIELHRSREAFIVVSLASRASQCRGRRRLVQIKGGLQ